MLQKKTSFTFNHADQQDDLYTSMTTAEIKTAFDSRGEELKKHTNDLIDALKATTEGDSGADNIGASAIVGVTGTTVQAQTKNLKKQIDDLVTKTNQMEQFEESLFDENQNRQNEISTANARIDTANQNISGLQTGKADKSLFDTEIAELKTTTTNLQNNKADKTEVQIVQNQLNQTVIQGDSSVEAAQARVKADGTSFTTLRDRLNTTDAQLAEKANDYHQLINYLESGSATGVTVYGDSITAGVGSTGYGLSTTNTIMTDSGGTTYYEPLTTSESWANHLRKYLASKFPSVVFKNRAIGGKSARYANVEKANWVLPINDISIVMLGTNDRWDSSTLEGFKTDLSAFLTYVKARSNLMIVMAAPPAQEYNADGTLKSPFLRGMHEINKAITEVCRDNNYIFISHFDLFFDYMTTSGASFDYLLETATEGGSHPKDSGYQLIWRNIQSKLHLKDNYSNWEGLLGGEVYRIRDQALISNSTPITDPIFKKGKTLTIEIFNSNSDLANFPEGTVGAGGDYRVYKGFNNDLYSYRTYRVRQSNNVYTSHWDYTNNVWKPWVKLPNRIPQRESITVSNISVPANSRGVANATATKIALNNSTLVYAVTPVSAPPAGIVMNWKLDTASNSIQLIFYNLTAAAITVSSFTINVSEVVTEL